MRISRNQLCLVVHFCTRMKNKVIDCTKSQQITIKLCRDSFMSRVVGLLHAGLTFEIFEMQS